ncbi:hypothetical protein H1C71_006064 [Ictidomys tridecemlineatus]|nr:hypothetical protein H1C71_006064 [Ictidomys tridecemlineatus]KAG3278987.1 hypothetical protein H1C71_006064 [Ictidomys tridecemlineatus]KAG3278988.1 hypothetical protein H1C71_006064 [Ictidomys tridecemlineatus]KAG3278989.1 hypothetical protein H1C71_006064 [Ictidomys tridecemlineatus]KAG3278990.1 hypothetical protein H1C71_006064 [Ictidomys tridecemlineatus]
MVPAGAGKLAACPTPQPPPTRSAAVGHSGLRGWVSVQLRFLSGSTSLPGSPARSLAPKPLAKTSSRPGLPAGVFPRSPGSNVPLGSKIQGQEPGWELATSQGLATNGPRHVDLAFRSDAGLVPSPLTGPSAAHPQSPPGGQRTQAVIIFPQTLCDSSMGI